MNSYGVASGGGDWLWLSRRAAEELVARWAVDRSAGAVLLEVADLDVVRLARVVAAGRAARGGAGDLGDLRARLAARIEAESRLGSAQDIFWARGLYGDGVRRRALRRARRLARSLGLDPPRGDWWPVDLIERALAQEVAASVDEGVRV